MTAEIKRSMLKDQNDRKLVITLEKAGCYNEIYACPKLIVKHEEKLKYLCTNNRPAH